MPTTLRSATVTDNAPPGGTGEEGGDDVGVGPHPLPWPDGPHFDPELLADGDRRNVADRYRYWTVDAIRDDLDRAPIPLEVAVENWEHDFNIGTVVRNANGFGVRRVHVVGRRRWNRRGAMVTDRYLDVRHHADAASLIADARERDLCLVAVENVEGAVPLESTPLPERALLVFGQEQAGVSPELLHAAELTVSITMRGSSRSFNAGVASGVAMFAWSQQHG